MCKRPLYCMAPMGPPPAGNAAMIRVIGILSYNQRHKNPQLGQFVSSIANPSVNQQRHWRQIGERTLHDFVPFCWATHTPMQYVTMRDKVIPQDELVFFVCDAEEILELPGIWTSDGNTASNETSVFPGAERNPYWTGRLSTHGIAIGRNTNERSARRCWCLTACHMNSSNGFTCFPTPPEPNLIVALTFFVPRLQLRELLPSKVCRDVYYPMN